MSDKVKYSTSMYIADTTMGVPQPVFFDTHTPIFNNRPPGILITGSPGGGKTFFALTLATISAMLGKTTVCIDPKGDFLPLAGLSDQLGPINLLNLGPLGKQNRAGILDPFYMSSDPKEKLSLAISVIDLFVGGLSDSEMSVLSPIVKDVVALKNPSLLKTVELLRASDRPIARDLGTKLDLISNAKGAKVCFAPGNKTQSAVSISSGLTIFTLLGLEMPADASAAKDTLTGRLASGILYLLTDFIRRVMHSDQSGNPKTLIIDEAWSIVASKQGADVIRAVALLGRSRQVSLVLVTQSTSHLTNLDIENTITTRFAFRTAQKEAQEIIKSMDLPDDEGFESILTSLENGECLMQDFLGRTATIKISQWRKDWAKAYETNPAELAERQRKQNKEK